MSNQRDFPPPFLLSFFIFWVITSGEWKEIERVHKFGILNSGRVRLKSVCVPKGLPSRILTPLSLLELPNTIGLEQPKYILYISNLLATGKTSHVRASSFPVPFWARQRCQTDAGNGNVPRMSNVLLLPVARTCLSLDPAACNQRKAAPQFHRTLNVS